MSNVLKVQNEMTIESLGINHAMAAAMREVDAIPKDKKAKGGGGSEYKFRGVDDAYNYLHDILAKHGIFTVPRVVEMLREERQSKMGNALIYTILKMEYDFIASDGSKLTAGPVIGEAMDSGDKSCNKAMSIAHKMCLFQIFMIPTLLAADPDQDVHHIAPQATPAPQTEAPIAPLSLMATIDDYRAMGQTTPEMNKYLDERKGKLTAKQAAHVLNRIESMAKGEA